MSAGAVIAAVVLLEGLLVVAAVLRMVHGLRSAPVPAPKVIRPISAPTRSAPRDSLPGPRDGGAVRAAT